MTTPPALAPRCGATCATARCPSSPPSRPSSASAARPAPPQALCIAQPTISGHLRKLGDALGVRLFELRGKRLVPTAAALALLEATHEVSAALARCEQTLGSYRETAPGRTPSHAGTRARARAQRRPSLNAIIARSLLGSTGLISRWKSCSSASLSWPVMLLPVTTIAGTPAPKRSRSATIAATPVAPFSSR